MARLFPMFSAEEKQRSFTANATWTAPLTTLSITKATGKGAAGTPASSGSATYREDTTITRYDFASKPSVSVGPTLISRTFWDGKPLPADYCNPPISGGDSLYPDATSRQKCYYFDKVDESFNNPATTGASATFASGVAGTSRTFPGGSGGPATAVTYDNVPVTPGQAYSIVVPSGGSITITYLE